MSAYVELHCQSAFSFREGASLPEELVAQAVALEMPALGICDRDGVYGMVRAWKAAQAQGLRVLHGAMLGLRDKADEPLPEFLVYAQNAEGWASLCELLTRAREGRPKGEAGLGISALDCTEGLVALAGLGWAERPEAIGPISEILGDRLYLAASRQHLAADAGRLSAVEDLGRRLGRKVVAVNRVLYHCPERQPLQDVLTCIRHQCTLDTAGRRLQANAERHLKSPAQMARLFADRPAWLARSLEIAERCHFHLGELSYRYPQEVVPEGHSPMSWLKHLVDQGSAWRWPEGVPASVRDQIAHELALIDELDFATYFLTVEDIVAIAREKEILCQGRGSAANSAVCYALGITAVDPAHSHMLFERFLSRERREPPDIDVDFEHERREEVIQAIYEKYGRDRAALVNEVIRYRPRSAVRDVGKALGLSLAQVDRMAKGLDRGPKSLQPERIRESGVDPDDPRVAMTLQRAGELLDFPRHVSIHVGGFVIAEGCLRTRCPVEPAAMEGRTVIQWDKDDVDAVGFVKVDVLALGMLTAIRKCFSLIEVHHGRRLELATVPPEDPEVYRMICRADTIGVFQIESRAQMSMLPRLRPQCFYDLVIEISLVRPGPIQGGMVHPYLRRRTGKEAVYYAHPDLEPILERTLGVPIFQEQVMEMSMAVGGFSPGEADELRRAMGAWRKRGGLEPLIARLVTHMQAKGIESEYAQQVASQILGFGEYGFPESHAASFSLLVYVSAWLKCHYPAAFTCALLNAQPMGFYAPSHLVADVQRHEVEVRPICVGKSAWDCDLEACESEEEKDSGPALRLGLRQVRGLGADCGERLVTARARAPFRGLADLALRAGLDRGEIRKLARADALACLGLSRQEALWQAEALWGEPLLNALEPEATEIALPEPDLFSCLQQDYASTGLSLRDHPIHLVRDWLDERGALPLANLEQVEDGRLVKVAGMVTCRQRPHTASGVVFMTLEDETGLANVVIWPRVYERQRRMVRGENLLLLTGRLQRLDEAVSILAHQFQKLPLGELAARSHDFH